jgi:hypothetical protein
LQWKLREALEHLRKEQKEAWKLEISERKRTANWKAGGHLGKEFMLSLCCPGAGAESFLITVRQNVGVGVRDPGVLMPIAPLP